jgi:hypothetical protein
MSYSQTLLNLWAVYMKRQVMKWMIWWWRMITRCEDEMTIFANVYRRSFQNEEVYLVSSVYAQSLCKLVLNNFSNNFIPCFSQRQPVCCQEATRHSQRSRTTTVVSPERPPTATSWSSSTVHARGNAWRQYKSTRLVENEWYREISATCHTRCEIFGNSCNVSTIGKDFL